MLSRVGLFLRQRAILTRCFKSRYYSNITPPEGVTDNSYNGVSTGDTPLSQTPKPESSRRRKKSTLLSRNLHQVFSEIPNILLNDQFKGIKRVWLNDNNVNLKNGTNFNYGLEESFLNECIEIAKATFNFYLSRKTKAEVMLSPTILLSYSGSNGDRMLERLSIGLARELNADWISIDLEIVSSILLYLRNSVREYYFAKIAELPVLDESTFAGPNGEMDEEDRRALSEFVKKKSGPKPRNSSGAAYCPELDFSISESPIITIIEYLESCLNSAKFDGLSKGRQVVYIHGDNELVNTNPLFRAELAKLSALRGFSTLFVVSEGSNFDPQNAFKLSMQELMPDGEEGSESIPRSIETRIQEIPQRSLAFKLTSQRDKLVGASFNSYPLKWILSKDIRAPRIMVTPPKNKSIHQGQIAKDLEIMHFEKNWNNLQRCLEILGNTQVFYHAILECFSERLDVLPKFFSSRHWSPEEILTFCLALPSVISPREFPLTEIFENFQRHRFEQLNHIPSIETRLKKPGRTEVQVEGLTKHEKRFLPSIVTPSMVQLNFQDIGALDDVKSTLHQLISLRLERPEYFSKGILKESVSGILLFGPPGTGKTMLAKAVAAQSGANFIVVNSSSIFDMYVGEGEKNVKALFSLARKISPCVLFIDEVDALLDSRNHSVGRASRVEIINEFMAEWDGVLSQNNGITIMAATNRPFALDDAVLRRLPRRILIDLPDFQARTSILKIVLKDDRLSEDVDIEKISKRCEQYSGSDLKNLCIAAALRSIKRHNHAISSEMVINTEDFEGALADVPASISDKMTTVQELREWDRTYGSKTSKSSPNLSFGFRKPSNNM